jgi:hypothetical protein
VHESHPWRIRELAPDFTVEDVWALPVRGRAEDFPQVLETLAASDPMQTTSLGTRFLWGARDLLGKWFDLGRISTPADEAVGALPIPGTSQMSLSERLPAELRGTAADVQFDALPFVPLYRTDDEFAAEISNRTVHGVLHLAWADQGDETFQAQLAVYVKPRGALGKAYMGFIKPFRYLIVYPALMRQVERQWNSRTTGGRGVGD